MIRYLDHLRINNPIYHGPECLLCRVAGRNGMTPKIVSHPTGRDLHAAGYRRGHKRVLSIERYNRPSDLARYLAEECSFTPFVCRDLRVDRAVGAFNALESHEDDIVFVIAPFWPDVQIHEKATAVYVCSLPNARHPPPGLKACVISVVSDDPEAPWESAIVDLLKTRRLRYDNIKEQLDRHLPRGFTSVVTLPRGCEGCFLTMEC